MTGTATRIMQWSITYTDDEGVEHTKWFDLDLSVYGGDASLWRVDPPLAGHEHILICDRGVMLGGREIDDLFATLGISVGEVPTTIPVLVEVFGARPDGSVVDMSTIAEPITLNRPSHGVDVAQILTALGYSEQQLINQEDNP